MITLYRKVRKQPKGGNHKRGKKRIIFMPRIYIGKTVKIVINGIKGIKKNLHYN